MSQTCVVQSLVYLQQLDQRVLGLAIQELLADVAQVVALLVILEVISRYHAATCKSGLINSLERQEQQRAMAAPDDLLYGTAGLLSSCASERHRSMALAVTCMLCSCCAQREIVTYRRFVYLSGLERAFATLIDS